MKKLFLFFVIINTNLLYSQWLQESILTVQDSCKAKYILSSIFDIQATSIQNKFSKKIIQGGEITENEKEKMFEKHKQLNRLGFEYQISLKAEDLILNLKNKKINWDVQLSSKVLFASSYSKDFFGLLTFGNEKFLGDTLNFKASRFYYYNFQKFGLGYTFNKINSKLYFNLVNLSSYFKASLNGKFYSDNNSDYFYWNAQANISQNPHHNFSNGIGFSLDYQQVLKLNLDENKDIYFQIKIEDIGAIYTKKANLISDTSFTFSGFGVNQLFQTTKIKKNESEWMDTLNLKRDTLTSWEILPFSISLQKLVNNMSLSKFQAFYGVKAYPTISYFPKIFIGTEYMLRKNIKIGNLVSYGGFGGFRFGAYSRLQWKKMYFFIGLEDIISVFSQKMYGKNINFRWSWLL